MKKGSQSFAEGVDSGFRDYVIGFLPVLKLDVETVEVDGKNKVVVKAKRTVDALEKEVLLEALKGNRRVGKNMLERFSDKMERSYIGEGVFISTSGFTDEAVEYAVERDISVYDSQQLQQMKSKGKADAGRNIYERIFAPGIEFDQARGFFEKNRRKGFFGLGSAKEEVDSIEGRFAPVGCFQLRKRSNTSFSSQPVKSVMGENRFYVNLTTCELYYAYLGIGGKGVKLKASNVLRRMLDLPEASVILLSEIFEQEEIVFDRLDPNRKLILKENLNNLIMLENLGFIGLRDDAQGYMSNLNIPGFNDGRYDLGGMLEVVESYDSSDPADDIVYQPRGLLMLLEDFFNAEGELADVTYMPYFRCRYVGSDERVRFDALDNLRWKR